MTTYDWITAETDDGVSLKLSRHHATRHRVGVCLCTHAMMANGSYMRKPQGIAEYLANSGIETFVLDWRGHGKSRPPDPKHHEWNLDTYIQCDLPAAIGAVCKRADICPSELVYLGHSLGGIVGLAALSAKTIPTPKAMTVWTTSLWRFANGAPLLRRAMMRAYRELAQRVGFAPIRQLRIGTDDEPRTYVEQLSSWAVNKDWLSEDGFDYDAGIRDVDIPIWPVAGEGDWLCRPADAYRMVRDVRHRLPLRRVGVAFGDARDANHFELFTDRVFESLWRELAKFAAQTR